MVSLTYATLYYSKVKEVIVISCVLQDPGNNSSVTSLATLYNIHTGHGNSKFIFRYKI